MDLSRILDGASDPSAITSTLDFFSNTDLQPIQHFDNDSHQYDYVLPVPMTSFQKQLTDDVVSIHRADIIRFLETGSLESEDLRESLDCLYANTQLIATHPYLLVQHYLPPNLILKDVYNRLAKASGKFSILVHLIDLIRDKKINVALISRAGKSFDLIESLLLGRMINYKRYSGTYLRTSNKPFKNYSTIHLFPSSQLDSTYIGSEKFDLIIAFDLTFNPTDSHIQAIRTQSRSLGSPPTPILRLIPYYSSEHIIYKLQHLKNDDETFFMKRVVSAISVLRNRAGSVPFDLKSRYVTGLTFLTSWLLDPVNTPWPIPSAPEIPTYSTQTVENSLSIDESGDLKMSEDSDVQSNGYHSVISELYKTLPKVKHEDSIMKENGADPNIKNEFNGGRDSMDIAPYSSATTNHEQINAFSGFLPYENSSVFPRTNIHRYFGNDENNNDDFYHSKRFKREDYSVSASETPLSFLVSSHNGRGLEASNHLDRGKILTHKILHRLDLVSYAYDIKESKLQTLVKTASQLQENYEGLSEENGKLVQQIKVLEEQLRVSERKAERHDTELDRTNKVLQNQKDELEKARKLLQDGVPDSSKLESQVEEIAKLQDKKKQAEEWAAKRTEEHDRMCGEYQKASTAAKEACDEAQSLKKLNKILESKLESKANDLRQLSFDEERKAKDEKIKELEIQILSMEEHMKRLLENERLQPTRSRYGVRNSATGFNRRTNSPSVGGRRGSHSVN